ncbi:NUDIX hydrolase [Anaerocolumna aminovalerica]|jgi:ADP-ribose pyrophosphatase YjhB (NUDIX family)|uniref:NUDIX hydrolase n=1 Tax=Anaerocolumna aminovalerica TaxID=1527 RepID=UPI001C0F2276|nr:NUDIX hydrolase [Anaerocolumna aminovalerica]MBU5331923.1 NUDIX hydrolase [Anaerocolumna aminovalerica]
MYIKLIETYSPANAQEAQDKKVILNYIKHFENNVLLRDNEIAHITSSGFIMNKSLDKALLVHHNIRNVWSWTGGHADGDEDLLHVSLKEAKEETGVIDIHPLTDGIASIDILPVFGHMKNSKYVNAHLHLSIAYVLIADEKNEVCSCSEENSGVEWFPIEKFTQKYFDEGDVYLYNKLISFAHIAANKTTN